MLPSLNHRCITKGCRASAIGVSLPKLLIILLYVALSRINSPSKLKGYSLISNMTDLFVRQAVNVTVMNRCQSCNKHSDQWWRSPNPLANKAKSVPPSARPSLGALERTDHGALVFSISWQYHCQVSRSPSSIVHIGEKPVACRRKII